jgi:hypothetical protein
MHEPVIEAAAEALYEECAPGRDWADADEDTRAVFRVVAGKVLDRAREARVSSHLEGAARDRLPLRRHGW